MIKLTLIFLILLNSSFYSKANGSCSLFLNPSASDLLKNFNASEQTHLFVSNTPVHGNEKNLIIGESYTAIANQFTGELIVGYKTKVPFLIKVLKGFFRTNSGTHLTLNRLFTGGGLFEKYQRGFEPGAFRINFDGSIDVGGFSGQRNNIYGAVAVANAIKKLSPRSIVRANSGRIKDIYDESEDADLTFYMGPDNRAIIQNWSHEYGPWRIR